MWLCFRHERFNCWSKYKTDAHAWFHYGILVAYDLLLREADILSKERYLRIQGELPLRLWKCNHNQLSYIDRFKTICLELHYFWRHVFPVGIYFSNIIIHSWEHTQIHHYVIIMVDDNVNYANPVYRVATICHQVRWLRWGHPSLFHIATSLLIWYKMFCVRVISYRLIWMELINMFSMYAQSGTHSHFNW